MGALWECVCFILRTLGAKDQQNSTYVTLSTLLFLLAPLCTSTLSLPIAITQACRLLTNCLIGAGINAFAYMATARLVYFLHPDRKALRIPANWLAKGFVTVDILSFIIQAAGGALMADQHNAKTSDLGRKVYMVGVAVQLVFVLVFMVVAASFYKDVDHDIRTGGSKTRNRWIRPLLWTIFVVLILIVVRTLRYQLQCVDSSNGDLLGTHHISFHRV